MSRTPFALALAATLVLGLAAAAPAPAKDYASTALNIIPSGQDGGLAITPASSRQAQMYDGLTPLFGNVTTADLFKYYKSEALGLGGDGPGRVERVPRKGVRVVRDSFDVPHITGRTHDDVTWAAGWVVEEDRGLLLQQARYPARLSALDAPNTPGFPLVAGLKAFTPSRQADAIVARQTKVLQAAGPDGRALLHDIDVYVQGINARLRREKSKVKPWTRVDIYSVNALLGELFGRGGGGEVQTSMLLDGLQKRLGSPGRTAWNDLTESQDLETPTTLPQRFSYGAIPARTSGNAIVDDGSFKPWQTAASSRSAPPVPHASNFLMIGAQRSANGHPLFVAGPQIGYFYPGLTLEMDLKGPGFEARGATSVTNPGSILIGRGPDYAWSLTSAGSDVTDEYVETLCGSDTRYRYKGRCRSMGRVNAGHAGTSGAIVYRTTVHGPVVGYATVHGRRVAISSKRSSHGRDILFELPFRDLTLNRVTSPRSFYKAMARSPFTFNSAYADDRHIAVFSGGQLPLRPKTVDPRLPTIGDGRFEWRGFLSAAKHAHGADPASGMLVNWNNKPAPGFAAADDNFQYGSIDRVQLLENGLAATPGKQDLASVVGAMNKAATQDLRSELVFPVIADVLAGAPAPNARDARMVQLMAEWRAEGSSRLDRDGDGKVDAPGAAIVDAAWSRIADAVLSPVLGPQLPELNAIAGADNNTQTGFTGGRVAYVDKDLRTLLGRPVKGPFLTHFCGAGDLASCRAALWNAIDQAGNELEAEQGPSPDAWRADANAERIHFAPGLLQTTMRYTNRPSGIQQVISFSGHR
jgi:acyl-homoserine lactone acylase PvdQ